MEPLLISSSLGSVTDFSPRSYDRATKGSILYRI